MRPDKHPISSSDAQSASLRTGICQHLGRPSMHSIDRASKISNSGTIVLPTTVRPHRQPNLRHPEGPEWTNKGTLRGQPHDSWPHVRAGSLPCKACLRPLIRRHTPNRTATDAQTPLHPNPNKAESRSEESQQQRSRDCRTGEPSINNQIRTANKTRAGAGKHHAPTRHPKHNPRACKIFQPQANFFLPRAHFLPPRARALIGGLTIRALARPPDASALPESHVRPCRRDIRPSRGHIFRPMRCSPPLKACRHTPPPYRGRWNFPPQPRVGLPNHPIPPCHAAINFQCAPMRFQPCAHFSAPRTFFTAPCQGAERGAAHPCACPPPGGKRNARVPRSAQRRAKSAKRRAHFPPRALQPPAQGMQTHPSPL